MLICKKRCNSNEREYEKKFRAEILRDKKEKEKKEWCLREEMKFVKLKRKDEKWNDSK